METGEISRIQATDGMAIIAIVGENIGHESDWPQNTQLAAKGRNKRSRVIPRGFCHEPCIRGCGNGRGQCIADNTRNVFEKS